MIARILWIAVLTAIGVVTASVQLDRQTRRTPVLATSVPEAARSSAQLAVAAYALSGDDPDYALAEAERLVRRRPLPAEHLRLLAQAQFAAGEVEQSSLTIQYAAQRGWRDPLAQESMLRLAIDAGDAPEAARRYAALFLRRETEDALLQEWAPQILSEPGGEGRKTLATIVGGAERWQNQFLHRGVRTMPPDAFAEIITTTAASGTRYDCKVIRQIETILEPRDAAAAAQIAEVIADQC